MSCGFLIIGLAGARMTEQEEALLRYPIIRGVILFKRNYEHRAQLYELIHSIRSVRKSMDQDSEFFIMVDQEGGLVQRFGSPDFTDLPSASLFGHIYDTQGREEALPYVRHIGQITAKELLDVGVNVNLAPVVDLNHETSIISLKKRSFHSNPAIVLDLASAYLDGVRAAGMRTVIKHFPGHGSVQQDSHEELPVDMRRYEDIEHQDLLPFQALIQKQAVDMVLIAHIHYPRIDAQYPASFSSYWLQEILRKKLNFKGLIISDCMSMKASWTVDPLLSNRIMKSLSAGCNLVIASEPAGKEIDDFLKLRYI
jgi:beta-N-acetylhexosaminidase